MLLKKISKTVLSVIEDSTVHGLPNIVKNERIINKIMWTIVFLASFGYCTYLIVNSILDYLQFDHITQIATVFEQPTQYFTIQFCSRDAKSFNNKTLNQLLIKCEFNYDTSCLTNPGPFFESYIDPTYTQCFRFNSGKNLSGSSIPILSSSIGGKDDSFSMQIYAPSGLAFWIHNYSTPPRRQFKNNHDGGLQYASVGFDTQVAVDRTFQYKLEYPYNDCLNDPTEFQYDMKIINFMINNSIPYSQVNCLELCFDMQYLMDNPCNCTNASLGNVWTNCYGKFNQQTAPSATCSMNYKSNWFKQDLIKGYWNYCPLECNSITYSVSTRLLSNQYPTNTSFIQAYYTSLKYTVISETPAFLLLDLISFIGGLSGLFLGASFLSFIEIVEMMNGVILLIIEALIGNLNLFTFCIFLHFFNIFDKNLKKNVKNKRKIKEETMSNK